MMDFSVTWFSTARAMEQHKPSSRKELSFCPCKDVYPAFSFSVHSLPMQRPSRLITLRASSFCSSARMQGVRKEKKRGGRSFYPLKKQKFEEGNQASSDKEIPVPRNITYCCELIENLMNSSPCIVPPGEPLNNSQEGVQESREGLLTRFSNAITKELYLIVEWAKLVPGFDELCRKDQIALLTAGGMELIVFRVIYRSIPYKEYVYMNSTTLLVREECYDVLNKEIVDMILDVVERLKPLAMDEVEFACLKTILLTDPETSGLSDKLAVAALQNSFLAALKEHMETTYPNQKGRFAKLLLRLPALRDVCTKGYQYFLLVRAKLEGEVPMSKLLQEMFESARY
ncbi:retinoic acid receptor RXR-alpha-like isoform X3 [Montipora foliosa]|uniref:retinoic acid receptor RXR-alpha-like isoform X3 n=1 Tax=Montipora foliosa TaxID=591990 RepID=UPI0035F1A120